MKLAASHSVGDTVTFQLNAGLHDPTELTGRITSISIHESPEDSPTIYYWVLCGEHSHFLRVEPQLIVSGAGTPFVFETEWSIGDTVAARGAPIGNALLTVVTVAYITGIGCRYVCSDGHEYSAAELTRRVA